MASTRLLSAVVAAAALLAVPAMALAASPDSMTPQDTMSDQNTAPPAATGTATNTSGQITDSATDQTAAVNTTVVTNGPIPDTRANRARYGAPMSNAGKRTAPAGN
jgi:hypothetical protein